MLVASDDVFEVPNVPSLVRDADGSLLLYRAAKDATAYRTFVSRLRAPALGWRDLLGPDRLSQGLTAREAVRRGVGTQAERDAAIPAPSMGDEWFNTAPAGLGRVGGSQRRLKPRSLREAEGSGLLSDYTWGTRPPLG